MSLEALLGLLAPAPPQLARIRCSNASAALCPEYAEGCFDYSPMYCRAALRVPAREPQMPPPAPEQAPARLWRSPEVPDLNSRLPMEAQFCARDACNSLPPIEASLCYCLATAPDPAQCNPPLGRALPVALEAYALCAGA